MNKQLLVLLINHVEFLNATFKVVKKIALRTFGSRFLNPYNSIVLCQIGGIIKVSEQLVSNFNTPDYLM